jgi:hypothetical protein
MLSDVMTEHNVVHPAILDSIFITGDGQILSASKHSSCFLKYRTHNLAAVDYIPSQFQFTRQHMSVWIIKKLSG